jgi:hypothetical protein
MQQLATNDVEVEPSFVKALSELVLYLYQAVRVQS